MTVLDDFADWLNNYVVDIVWLVALVCIFLIGIFFILRLDFPNLKIRESLHIMRNRKSDSKGISTMGSFFVALSSRMGAGNIIGVSVAIIVGGPGAILWMWVFSLFGAALCFAECILGQIFKEKRSDGVYRGGPAYYALKGLRSERVAIAFAILLIVIGLIFGGIQACNMNNAIRATFDIDSGLVALIIACFVLFTICVGIKKITKAMTYLVPVFAGVWIVAVLITMATHADRIPEAIGSIFSYGLGFESLPGAGIGFLMITGFKRGAFCSEGGTGQISSVSSSADDDHPCVQGFMQAFGVYVDIFFICTMSALLVLSYGIDNIPFGLENADQAIALIINSLESGFLGEFSRPFFTLVIVTITFASIFANYVIAEANVKYLFHNNRKSIIVMNVIFVATIFFMSTTRIGFVWAMGDIVTGLLTLLNIYLIYKLFEYIKRSTSDYRAQRKRGVNKPTFNSETALMGLDTSNISEWKS